MDNIQPLAENAYIRAVKETKGNMDIKDNDTYRHVHFAVMAIESGAKNMGISGKEMHDRLKKQGLIHNRLFKRIISHETTFCAFVAEKPTKTSKNTKCNKLYYKVL